MGLSEHRRVVVAIAKFLSTLWLGEMRSTSAFDSVLFTFQSFPPHPFLFGSCCVYAWLSSFDPYRSFMSWKGINLCDASGIRRQVTPRSPTSASFAPLPSSNLCCQTRP